MKDYTGITGQAYEITATFWTPQGQSGRFESSYATLQFDY